jgi:cytochrome P450
VQPIIQELLARFIDSGKVELTSAFSDLLPPRVIMSLLNMPWQDDTVVKRVLDLHETMMAWASGQNPAEFVPKAKAASAELNAMLLPFVRERRDNPADDLISRVWTEWPKELGEVNEGEALAICREMFMAGSETTIHALANALHMLLTEPDTLAAVRADRNVALANLVEESLRLFGAVQYRFRVADEDCELGGVTVKKDQVLILINSAANRDPAKYGHPAQTDLARPRPRDHLAFNTGPRVCVGAALARGEMVDAINALLDTMADLRLDPAAEQPAFPGHFNRSFRPLHVLFDSIKPPSSG